jgi:hypothetical protein
MIDPQVARLTDAGTDIISILGESHGITNVHKKLPKLLSFHWRPGWTYHVSRDETALIRPSHEQHVQMKSRKSLGVITGDPRGTHPHGAKSSTSEAQGLLRIRRRHSQARPRRGQTAAKLTAFTTGVRRFIKAYAILRQKLYARFSEHAFDQGNRVPASRVATHLDIRDRVSMEPGRPSQVPNRQIERGPSDLVQVPRTRQCAHLTCDKVTTAFTTSPNQGGIQ